MFSVQVFSLHWLTTNFLKGIKMLWHCFICLQSKLAPDEFFDHWYIKYLHHHTRCWWDRTRGGILLVQVCVLPLGQQMQDTMPNSRTYWYICSSLVEVINCGSLLLCLSRLGTQPQTLPQVLRCISIFKR